MERQTLPNWLIAGIAYTVFTMAVLIVFQAVTLHNLIFGLIFASAFYFIKITKWPGWLKGSLISLIVYGALFALTYDWGLTALIFNVIPSAFFPTLAKIVLRRLPINELAFHLIVSLIFYFLVGALIGWKNGKRKSKKQSNLNQTKSKK